MINNNIIKNGIVLAFNILSANFSRMIGLCMTNGLLKDFKYQGNYGSVF